jgi:hypothetical protein
MKAYGFSKDKFWRLHAASFTSLRRSIAAAVRT